MSTVQEIESAIDKLSDKPVAGIRAWLFDRDGSRDATKGWLDSLAEEAFSDARAGRAKLL